MKLNLSMLPSKSLGCKITGSVNIDILTYYDIINYVSDKPSLPNSIAQLYRDIEFILAPRVDKYKELSSFDLNFLISIRKLYSVIKDGKFSLGTKEYSLDDVSFSDIDTDTMRINKVLNKDFKISTIGDVLNTIENTDSKYFDLDSELVVLASDMGVPVEYLLNLSATDIATIEVMKSKVMSQPVVGGEEGITLFGKSSDLFQSILLTHKTDELKIGYSEVL